VSLKRLKNLVNTAKDVGVGFVKTGKLLNKDPHNRIEICKRCECFDKNWCSKDKCKALDGLRAGCGCYLPAKTRLEFANCPRGKW
jgi:hypothetical protein